MQKYDSDQLAVEMTFSILNKDPYFITSETSPEAKAKQIAVFVETLSIELEKLDLSKRSIVDR